MRTMEVVEEGAMVVVAKRFLWRKEFALEEHKPAN
jgi:hypothetical protein